MVIIISIFSLFFFLNLRLFGTLVSVCVRVCVCVCVCVSACVCVMMRDGIVLLFAVLQGSVSY